MCTLEKRGSFFILTLTGDDEHRLNPDLIASILAALSKAKAEATRGSVLITTAQGKYFSNGFDLAWAKAAGSPSAAQGRLHGMVYSFKPVIAALLSLPMPTVAAISGHAAAAGFKLALSHDYIFMRRDRGVLYMSEVDIGLPLPDYFTALSRGKISSSSARRDILLRGAKIKGEEAVRMGIVDAAHDGIEGVMEASVRLAEELSQRKWKGEVYSEIRKSQYPEVCGMLGLATKSIASPRL